MKELIGKRIEELKEQHTKIEAEIQQAQGYLQQKVAEINGIKRAIMEFEKLLTPETQKKDGNDT
jgi:predicted  nucleic acid-binding Zn-ribbon protein